MARQRGEGCDWHIGKIVPSVSGAQAGSPGLVLDRRMHVPPLYSLHFFLSWDIMSTMSDLPASAQARCLADQALRHAGTAAKVTWLG